jgi:iron-sulfur cluster assembly accessory protein
MATDSHSSTAATDGLNLSDKLAAARSSFGQIATVTEAAARKLEETLKDKPGYGIRLGVKGGGCAGLQYEMTPCNEAMDGDFVQEQHGIRLYIHPVAAAYLKGITLDYSDALMDGGFRFINPNASSTCGCGTSFGV